MFLRSSIFLLIIFTILVNGYVRQNFNYLKAMNTLLPKSSLNSNEKSASGDIFVYTRPGCKYCRIAKATLTNMGICFNEININDDNVEFEKYSNLIPKELYLERLEYTKQKTVPQIYIGDDHIGGCDDLLKQIESNTFVDILKKWNITPVSVSSTSDNDSTSSLNLKDSNEIDSSIKQSSIKLQYLNQNLNSNTISNSNIPPYTPLELSKLLQNTLLELSDEFISKDGKKVNYVAMETSTAFQKYISLTQLLSQYSIEYLNQNLNNSQKLSFFINIYNSLIIHATCVIGAPANNPSSRTLFFNGSTGAVYNISGYLFSPDDIEHGILRANTAHPSQAAQGLNTFFQIKNDPRIQLAVSPPLDPRIHFILNCGASSCPPIAVLGNEPETALQLAAIAYLENEMKFDLEKRVMYLPKLMLWYGQDFGSTISQRIQWIINLLQRQNQSNGNSSDSIGFIEKLKLLGWNENSSNEVKDDELPFTIEYNNYDWTTNDYDNDNK